MSIKAKYSPETGLINVEGNPGMEVSDGMQISRNVTLTTSLAKGVKETSGSLLQLKGKREGIHFHVGGNQYVSSNAWFDADEGTYGSWKYETSDSAAFRWGFVGSSGRFDLDYAVRGTAGEIVTGSSIYATSGAWGYGLSLSASLGAITIGKQAGPRKQQTWGRDDGDDVKVQHGANAVLDITGSFVETLGRPTPLTLAVTGSVEVGCGAANAYFLFPLHTNATRNALITTNAEGMVIYNTETHKLNFWNGTNWMEVAGSIAP